MKKKGIKEYKNNQMHKAKKKIYIYMSNKKNFIYVVSILFTDTYNCIHNQDVEKQKKIFF